MKRRVRVEVGVAPCAGVRIEAKCWACPCRRQSRPANAGRGLQCRPGVVAFASAARTPLGRYEEHPVRRTTGSVRDSRTTAIAVVSRRKKSDSHRFGDCASPAQVMTCALCSTRCTRHEPEPAAAELLNRVLLDVLTREFDRQFLRRCPRAKADERVVGADEFNLAAPAFQVDPERVSPNRGSTLRHFPNVKGLRIALTRAAKTRSSPLPPPRI